MDDHLTEKLPIMITRRCDLEERGNEDVGDRDAHNGEPDLPEHALLDGFAIGHALRRGRRLRYGSARIHE